MFEDSFLINLFIFALGQVAAYGYLRTGRMARGIALIVVAWILADVALLEVLAYDRRGGLFRCCLVGMQVYSLVEFGLFVFGRTRRRKPITRAQREKLFRKAWLHYLADELEEARDTYHKLVRLDGWDLQSTIGLGTVMARLGHTGKARALFRSARHLDLRGEFADPIGEELARLHEGKPKTTVVQNSRPSKADQAPAAKPTKKRSQGKVRQ